MSLVMAVTDSGSVTVRHRMRTSTADGGQVEATAGGDVVTPPGQTVDPTKRTTTPTYENAPIRATAEDVAGFGPLATLLALILTGLIAVRRRRRET